MNERDTQLLEEMRDLLKEQLRLTAEIKAKNEEAFRKNQEYLDKAEKLGKTSLSHSQAVFSSWGWMKWGFWIFLAILLLVFLFPTLLSLFRFS